MIKINKKIAFICLIVFVLVSITTGILIAQNDPVESIKQRQDEKLQANAAEFIQATVLYYSTHNGLPWFAKEENGANCFGDNTHISAIPMQALQPCVEGLMSESALRKDFASTTAINSLYVTNPNPQTGEKLDTVVCFQPQSEMWQKDFNTRYGINGEIVSDNRCHSQGGVEFCYWCTQ